MEILGVLITTIFLHKDIEKTVQAFYLLHRKSNFLLAWAESKLLCPNVLGHELHVEILKIETKI